MIEQSSERQPVRITITGAGGQIGYALVFRIASGDLLGPDIPVELRLLEIPQGLGAAEGTALELADCAFPLLRSVDVTDIPSRAFDGANHALLVGARPRGPGMERADLLKANAGIFGPQGRIIAEHAADDIRVTVVGNPANTNALIAYAHAPNLPANHFTALTRLDQNRAKHQLAGATDVPVTAIKNVTIWGNHSASQYPDVSHATANGKPVRNLVSEDWVTGQFIPRVARRGAEIIEVRGSSSAASAASAVIDHVHTWVNGTPEDEWTSVALPSDGSYGVPEGLVSSFPARSIDGEWSIVEGLDIDAFSRERIDASVRELEQERDIVRSLGVLPA